MGKGLTTVNFFSTLSILWGVSSEYLGVGRDGRVVEEKDKNVLS